MTTFARPRGERAKVVQWDEGSGTPPPALYADLRVGDLIHDENGYRSLESFVVTAEGTLAPIGADGNGDGTIPVSVARHLEDPLDFYASELAGIVCDVEFDPDQHASALEGAELEVDENLPEGTVWWSLGTYRAGAP